METADQNCSGKSEHIHKEKVEDCQISEEEKAINASNKKQESEKKEEKEKKKKTSKTQEKETKAKKKETQKKATRKKAREKEKTTPAKKKKKTEKATSPLCASLPIPTQMEKSIQKAWNAKNRDQTALEALPVIELLLGWVTGGGGGGGGWLVELGVE